MQAVVLCGGMASRLGAIANDVPKSLLPVRGRPFLEWLLIDLARCRVHNVVLATGHLSDQVERAIGDGSQWGVSVAYSAEPEPLGTGGAVRLAAERIAEWPLLVLNGDSYTSFDVHLMTARHRRAHADATLWLAPSQPGRRYGSIDVDADGTVIRFDEKSLAERPWISAGIYLLERRALDGLEVGKVASIERDVFPQLAGRLSAVRGPAPVVDIGVPESLAGADSALAFAFRLVEMTQGGDLIWRHMNDSRELQSRVARECGEQIVGAARLIAASFGAGGKLLLCGNGGSAADCQHMAAEFTNRLSAKVDRGPLPAIALTTDTSFLTAFANDFGFEGVFARQVEAIGRPGDVLLGISTSGNSRNVLAAFESASRAGVSTIALTGSGGAIESLADCAIVIPSSDTQLLQEAMLPVEHLICELTESLTLH